MTTENQSEEKVSTITMEQLLADGWVKTSDPVFPMEKVLSDTEDEDYDPEEGDLKMVLHRMYNTNMFALSLPDGGLININPASMEELNGFANQVASYDPPY